MIRGLILYLLLLFCAFSQSTKVLTKSELTNIYVQAIGDFITASDKQNKSNFDTLFFGKRKNGQPDDFPDIELPKTIEKTEIRLIKSELAEKSQKVRNSRIYINLIGWADKENAEFIFVVFSNGFKHQYDYWINYTFNTKLKKFDLNKLEFKEPPFNK